MKDLLKQQQSVDEMRQELCVKQTLIAVQVGESTLSLEIPGSYIPKLLKIAKLKNRTIFQISDLIKVGIDIKEEV